MDNFDRPGRIATRTEAFIYFSIKISENFGKMKINFSVYGDNWVVDVALIVVTQWFTRLSGWDKFLDKSYVCFEKGTAGTQRTSGATREACVQVLAFNRNSSEQKKLLDERQEPTLVIASALWGAQRLFNLRAI